ncbi:MAG: acetyl-CoA acetyltransferase [Acidimicrobiales bacterium]
MKGRSAGTPIASIVGVAESSLGITGKSILELQSEATLAALDDAGLALHDVDGLFTNGAGQFSASQVAEYLGIRPRWTDSTMAGGASYELFVARAAEAIDAGLVDVALVSYGSNQRSARSRRLGGPQGEQMPAGQLEAPYGPLNPISLYAMAARRHFHEHGTTPEQLAEVAVAARQWALRNPRAFRHDDGPITVDDVLASPLVSSPLHTLDCCLVTDGGGAVVLASLERARSLRPPVVSLVGHGEATTNVGMSQVPDLTRTGAVDSGRRAFAMAGLEPGDVDVTEIYDSFTITVLLTLEALGFCPPGESGAFLADGRARPGGAFPLNTSGGGLSYCHPGMFGIFLVIEAVRQLRGEADGRQVPGPEVALAHGTGGILSTHATLLLRRER